MRRPINAIIAALLMDPERRELYVEGISDQSFLRWMVGFDPKFDTRIVTIDSVDIEIQAGGNRERVIEFAKNSLEYSDRIRFFVDADNDRLQGKVPPANTWFTDGRDTEGYFFTEKCFLKFISFSLPNHKFSSSEILSQIKKCCSEIGYIRLYDSINNLSLPFQKMSLKKMILGEGNNQLDIDITTFLRSLIQNANISLSKFEEIKTGIDLIKEKVDFMDDLVHGKDAIDILRIFLLRSLSLGQDGVGLSLRTCFEKEMISDFQNLTKALDFVSTGR